MNHMEKIIPYLETHAGRFEEELKSLEKKIDQQISESVKNALEAPEPLPQELTKYIWAED